ncbi:MAG: DUF58 domain-containing protein, partial [Melioribacteraceae bacterium]|nr:DUF58 domain-containing protein [Melioribacteraceae bacterium]
KSMDYKQSGSISKLEYAKILAASLIYLMINQQDAVSLALYDEKLKSYFPPRSTKIYLKELLIAIEKVKAGSRTETASSLNKIAEKIKKRGIVIIISDFMDSLDSILSAIKHFHYKKNEVILFQILDPIEKSFAFGNDSVFVDMETDEEITTQPYQIQKAYQDSFGEFLDTLKAECRNYGIEYNLIETDQPFDKALLSYFKKRSKLN